MDKYTTYTKGRYDNVSINIKTQSITRYWRVKKITCGLGFWTTTKIGVIMKSVRKIIKEMVEKYPNDMELGARVRWYIRWLYGEEKTPKPKDWSV